MKVQLNMVLITLALAGCVGQSPSFSWYHPMGGEYLFAYDSGQCESRVADQGLTLGTDIRGPFFSCMFDRGYYLVDSAGVIHEPPSTPRLADQQVSQQ